jgi:hypothetical protein
MFKNLVDFTNFEALGIATTVFFFVVFVAIVIRALFLRKSFTSEMENLPLQDGTLTTATNDADKD